ncbi:DUF4114 domain-containing protein [Okeanomitos corallinicola TIOX110]|uniref:DUF4114 domain-containing protein n=1 Tax=Okeanomitos corallinicola TIOX110 TaxID=3133117 RepID=A0ABZ2US99_9CYAN
MADKFFNTSTLNGENGFIIVNGNTNDDNLGYSVHNAGDINGDGIDDLIIGAPQTNPNGINNAGASYIIFGSNQGFPTTIEVSTLNGINGFTIIGSTESEALGRAVSAAGDVNGDGIEDLIVGAPFADRNNKENIGSSYIIFGKRSFSSTPIIDPSTLNGNNGFTIRGLTTQDLLGYSVSNAGDINNDGFDDLVIGAPNAYTTNNGKPGQTYIVFGSSNFNANFNLNNLDGSNGFVINGNRIEDYSGLSVSSAGDINNDGIDDLIIGAPQATPNGTNSGQAYIIYGKEGSFSPSLDIDNLNINDGFIINGVGDSKFGFSVSSAGDINNDGIDDLIIGAHDDDANGVINSGITYVIFGKNGNFNTNLDLTQIALDGNNGFIINGINEFDNSGFSVSGIGDVSGDGIDDLLISANNADPNGQSSGQSYVVFGNSNLTASINLADIDGTNGFVINGKLAGDNLGISVGGGGDVNGDGISDLIISAPFASSGAGESYVIFGVNNAPTDLTLSNNTVDENVGNNAVIGQFTTVDPNVKVQDFTYTLDAGFGDNDAFIIEGESLKIKQSPDFETKSSYTIRVTTTDQGGLSYQKEFTININDVDENSGNENTAPTDLTLSITAVDENAGDNAVIGTLTTTDANADDSFTYSLDNDENYPDNDAFVIDGESLKIKQSPDFETKSSYNISVVTTDAGGLSLVKQFTINVNDINEDDQNNNSGSGSENNGGGESLATRLVQVSDDVFRIESQNTTARLEVKLTGKDSNDVNEIAVFTVDNEQGAIDGINPGQAGYTEAALTRSKIIFSTISKIPNEFDISEVNKLLGFNNNDNLRFYLVRNGSTDSLQAGTTPLNNVIFPDSSTLRITELSEDNFSLAWEYDADNAQNFNDLVVNIKATDNPLPLGTALQDRPQGENIDLRDLVGAVNAEFTVYREAAFDNYVGFYKVTDANGGIDVDGDGAADLLPGQAGYTQAAVNQHLSNFGLSVANGGTATFTGTLEGGAIYVPFLIVDGRPDAILDGNASNDPAVYFTYLGANSDGIDHVRLLGDNTFGFEDIRGGGDEDFNDMIVQFNLQSIA